MSPKLAIVLAVIQLSALAITVYFMIKTWRMQTRHHRLMDMRMIFLELWGSGTYEFIRTGKGWHAVGHRGEGDVVRVRWMDDYGRDGK